MIKHSSYINHENLCKHAFLIFHSHSPCHSSSLLLLFPPFTHHMLHVHSLFLLLLLHTYNSLSLSHAHTLLPPLFTPSDTNHPSSAILWSPPPPLKNNIILFHQVLENTGIFTSIRILIRILIQILMEEKIPVTKS